MRKQKTLVLQRKAQRTVKDQANLNEPEPSEGFRWKSEESARLIIKKPNSNVLKPFLHREKTSKTYLYLGKKVKILLGDL